jgi:hypothetical protein
MSADVSHDAVARRDAAIRLLLAVMFMMVAGDSRAQIYECIAANGKLEFSQKCAPGTVRQREVVKAGAGSSDKAAPPLTSYQEQEHAFRQRQFAREAQERKESAAADAAAKKCKAAREQLSSLENARRVRGGSDPKTGEARYLDDNERAAATNQARDAVSAYCK